MYTQANGDVHIAQIRLKQAFLQHVAEETLGQNSQVELIQALQARDAQIESIVMMLVRELQQPSLGGQLYIDSLANVLAVHLLRHHTTIKPTLATSYRGGLSQSQLSRVLDYIEEHLGDNIQLNDLAQLVDISQFHFGRLFKQSIGHTPYQYLLQQRIERAKQLLKQTDAPIIDIAFDCGFSSHSHLSQQFRQSTGITPKTYRAS